MDTGGDVFTELEIELAAHRFDVVGAGRNVRRESRVIVSSLLGKEAAADMKAEIADQRHAQTVVLEIGKAGGQRVVEVAAAIDRAPQPGAGADQDCGLAGRPVERNEV